MARWKFLYIHHAKLLDLVCLPLQPKGNRFAGWHVSREFAQDQLMPRELANGWQDDREGAVVS